MKSARERRRARLAKKLPERQKLPVKCQICKVRGGVRSGKKIEIYQYIDTRDGVFKSRCKKHLSRR